MKEVKTKPLPTKYIFNPDDVKTADPLIRWINTLKDEIKIKIKIMFHNLNIYDIIFRKEMKMKLDLSALNYKDRIDISGKVSYDAKFLENSPIKNLMMLIILVLLQEMI